MTDRAANPASASDPAVTMTDRPKSSRGLCGLRASRGFRAFAGVRAPRPALRPLVATAALFAILATAATACASGSESSSDDAVILENATPDAVVIVAMTPEAATRYDPARSFDVAPDDPRRIPPGGERSLTDLGYDSYDPDIGLFLFLYRVRDDVAELTGTRAVDDARLRPSNNRIRIETPDSSI